MRYVIVILFTIFAVVAEAITIGSPAGSSRMLRGSHTLPGGST